MAPEVVAASQRERLIGAFTELVYEEGFAKATVAAIAKRSGVSSADFYKHFKAKDDCFAAAYDDAVERLRTAVLGACAGADGSGEPDDWPGAVRAALAALLGHLAATPAQARLLLVEGLFAGPAIHDRYQRALDSFVPNLRDGGMGAGAAAAAGAPHPDLPEPTAEALVGGIVALVSKRILAGEGETLPELLPELTRFTLAPYEGAE